MNNEAGRGKYTSLLFIIMLFLALTICALFTVLIGAGVYENINGRMEENYSGQTALSYISNQVKQSDLDGGVHVEWNGDTSILVLENSEYPGYQTKIYYYDGYIEELFAEKDSGIELYYGEDIIAAKGLKFSEPEPGLIKVELEPSEGNPQTLMLTTRSMGGAYE